MAPFLQLSMLYLMICTVGSQLVTTSQVFLSLLENAFKPSSIPYLQFAAQCSNGGMFFPSFSLRHQSLTLSNANTTLCLERNEDSFPGKVFVSQRDPHGMLSLNLSPYFDVQQKEGLELCVALIPIANFHFPATHLAHWCGSVLDVSSGGLLAFHVQDTGEYLAAAQIRVNKGSHAAVTHLHIINITLLEANSEGGRALPAISGDGTLTFAPVIDFVIGGFPKTGTSSIWYNLGYSKPRGGHKIPVNMYPTEPADWSEIQRWRQNLHKERGEKGGFVEENEMPDKRPLVGFKATQFMYDPRWALCVLELNPRAKFVVSLRKPSAWLQSFVRYRQKEIADSADRSSWAAIMAAQQPELLTITFSDVALRGIAFLGAHRSLGHFVDWVEPFLAAVLPSHPAPGTESKSQQDVVLVVFVEEMAVDAVLCHRRIGSFLGLEEHELPSDEDLRATAINTRVKKWQPLGVEIDGIEAKERQRASSVAIIAKEEEEEEEVQPILDFLDDFYLESTTRLNECLNDVLGVVNNFW
mmetsp:Transcript_35105/g.71574  ORF Transcript_35105/g.71574 Transcript_35105/m.71574 type:complete len:526 (-) Transcript_35105:140-1717(-)